MKKLFVIVASVVLISVQPVLSAELTILTENLPPLNYLKDGVLVGPSVEIVKGVSMGKSLQNGLGRRKCGIVWYDLYKRTS
jgi:hypothetical protein